MKKKIIYLSIAILLVAIGFAFWMFRPQPSRVALVNFPQFMVARMSLSANARNVTTH